MSDRDSGIPEFLWPERDLPLFVGDAPDWQHDAQLPTRPDWLLYRLAYRRALELLVSHVVERDSDQDFLVYPILFIGRHAIELGLKHVIRLEQCTRRQPPDTRVTHDLLNLWGQLRELLEEDPTVDSDDLDAVQMALESLSESDARSFAFRYPTDLKGVASFEAGVESIPDRVNVRELGAWFERILNFLDGCTEYLYALWDATE